MYKHKKNNKIYIVFQYDVKIKQNDVWIDAVLYYRLYEQNQLFFKSVEEFKKSFIKVD